MRGKKGSLCKRLKFGYTTKWYTQNQNRSEMYEILWDSEIQTYHLILVRSPDLVLFEKMSYRVKHRVKMKESKRIDKYLDPCERTNKAAEHEGNGDTNSSWCAWNGSKRIFFKCLKELRNLKRILTIQSIPLIRMTQTSVEDYQLMLVGKTRKE